MSGSNTFFDKSGETTILTSSGNFVVPNRINVLQVLAVGAGAGGSTTALDSEAAGAGNIENIFIPVTPGETVTITIGVGGDGEASFIAATDGGDTIISTSLKDYYFFGGVIKAGAGHTSERQRRYAQDGENVTDGGLTGVGGVAGYGNGGAGHGTFVDGNNGGIGAGGGSTTDGGQSGGSGGPGIVQIWYKD